MRRSIAVLGFVFLAVATEAHDGHSHDKLSSPHGGVVHEGKKKAVELVQEGKTIKLYPVDQNWKLISLKDVKMTAQVEFPKKKNEKQNKTEKLNLQKAGDHFFAEVDAKGAYRYQVILEVSIKDVKETIRFQVEPQ